jgi:nitrite reductase/ring-hydroxylating ferredoxin subunit
MERTRLTTVGEVERRGTWLFHARERHGETEELVLTRCEGGDPPVRGWRNRCTHESQRLDRGGPPGIVRDGGLVCPRHGSSFDTCSGECDNGEAAGTTLPEVDVTVEDGVVYLTDTDYTFAGEGETEDDGGGPSSTSHIGF